MDILGLKEQILLGKLELLKHQQLKYNAVQRQTFGEAQKFRELEQKSLDRLVALKEDLLKRIASFDFEIHSLRNYAELNELLMEFHPIEFRKLVRKEKSKSIIEAAIQHCWEYRKDLYSLISKEISDTDF